MSSQSVSSQPPVATKKRLRALDTFRGIAIVLMIFVNSGGGGYRWLRHATWDGLYVADLVFPSFLWIMGVCLPFALRSQLDGGGVGGQLPHRRRRRHILVQVLVRSLKLFALGVCVNSTSGAGFEELRLMGVLQRFGITYGVVAGLYVWLVASSELEATVLQAEPTDGGRFAVRRVMHEMRDVRLLWRLWLCLAAVVAVYLVVVLALPVPGCPR